MRSTPLLALSFALFASGLSPADAQVHRCTKPDGTPVFTDRACGDVGASKASTRTQPAAGALRQYRGGCARNVQDLVYEMTTAIDAQDPNRLAGVYHWVGLSSDAAATLMTRLDAIAHRPLVGIVPVAPRAPEDAADALSGGDYYPPSTVNRAPVALRVEQTARDSVTPASTVFGLRRHLGCLWITL